jgi:DNA-binding MarR family transcriptional regulator
MDKPIRAGAAAVPRSEGVRPLEADVDLGLMRDSVSFQLRHASWAVHAAFAAQFAPADAVPRQYSVLYLIGINPAISVKSLAAAIAVDQSTLVPTLNHCEDLGWIRRDRGKPDRRLVALDLTVAGREALAGLQRKLEAHEAAICAGLTAAERQLLLVLLGKIRAAALPRD